MLSAGGTGKSGSDGGGQSLIAWTYGQLSVAHTYTVPGLSAEERAAPKCIIHSDKWTPRDGGTVGESSTTNSRW